MIQQKKKIVFVCIENAKACGEIVKNNDSV